MNRPRTARIESLIAVAFRSIGDGSPRAQPTLAHYLGGG